jgi:PIN domain nuclease of toxin-antitoxin system
MRLLLDTHIWLWSLLEPKKLSRRVLRALESPSSELWLSPVSTWEFFLLARKKRIVLDADPGQWLKEATAAAPMREAAFTHQVAIESGKLELPHKDPADHFLVATAMVFDLTLVTADEALLQSRAVRMLSNRTRESLA